MFFGMNSFSQKRASSLRLGAVALASALLCIAFFFLVPSQFAYAEEATVEGVTYSYIEEDSGIVITSITQPRVPSGYIPPKTLPLTIGDKPVLAIGREGMPAFVHNIGCIFEVSDCSTLKEINISSITADKNTSLGTTGVSFGLTVSNCENLQVLKCAAGGKSIATTLSVSDCSSLKVLECSDFKLFFGFNPVIFYRLYFYGDLPIISRFFKFIYLEVLEDFRIKKKTLVLIIMLPL